MLSSCRSRVEIAINIANVRSGCNFVHHRINLNNLFEVKPNNMVAPCTSQLPFLSRLKKMVRVGTFSFIFAGCCYFSYTYMVHVSKELPGFVY